MSASGAGSVPQHGGEAARPGGDVRVAGGSPGGRPTVRLAIRSGVAQGQKTRAPLESSGEYRGTDLLHRIISRWRVSYRPINANSMGTTG